MISTGPFQRDQFCESVIDIYTYVIYQMIYENFILYIM